MDPNVVRGIPRVEVSTGSWLVLTWEQPLWADRHTRL